MKLILNINLNNYCLKVIRKDDNLIYAITGNVCIKEESLSNNQTRTTINSGVLKGTIVKIVNSNKVLKIDSIYNSDDYRVYLNNRHYLSFRVDNNKFICKVINAVDSSVFKTTVVEI